MVGPHEYLHGANHPGNIWVDPEEFPEGEFAVTWEESRGRGGFSQGVRNVAIDCNGVANGIWLNGDQESHYLGLKIDEPHDLGVLLTTSHGSTLVNLTVEGRKEQMNGTVGLQIGLQHRMATATTLMGSSFNWCTWGIFRNNAFTVDDYGTSFENTGLPYYTYKSRSCFSRAHLMLTYAPDGVIARLESSYQLQMSGTLRKSAFTHAYVDDDGQEALVSSRAHLNGPQGWVFVHSSVQDLDLPADNDTPTLPENARTVPAGPPAR